MTEATEMPTFLNVRDAALYGIPTEIDGVPLSEIQVTKVMPNMIGKLMDQANHPLDVAVERAVAAFRKSYVLREGRWTPLLNIRLSAKHGGTVRNRFYQAEQRRADMGRERAEDKSPVRRMVESAMESGARNSKTDRTAIQEVVKLALSQLNKDDKLQTLKDLGYKVKE